MAAHIVSHTHTHELAYQLQFDAHVAAHFLFLGLRLQR